nr:hypothetical protein Iba_chr12eCG10030 [Ipomoea batatas]
MTNEKKRFHKIDQWNADDMMILITGDGSMKLKTTVRHCRAGILCLGRSLLFSIAGIILAPATKGERFPHHAPTSMEILESFTVDSISIPDSTLVPPEPQLLAQLGSTKSHLDPSSWLYPWFHQVLPSTWFHTLFYGSTWTLVPTSSTWFHLVQLRPRFLVPPWSHLDLDS